MRYSKAPSTCTAKAATCTHRAHAHACRTPSHYARKTLYRNMPAQSARTGMLHMNPHTQQRSQHARTERTHMHVVHLVTMYAKPYTATCLHRAHAQARCIRTHTENAQQHACTERTRTHVAYKAAMCGATCP